MLLLQYAQWYRSVYELPLDKQPAKETLDNDEAMDDWWDAFIREIKNPPRSDRAGQKSVLARDGGDRAFRGNEFKG